MTVLAPLLLAAGLALAVPLILHLWHRSETETEAFPALRYLLTSTRDRDRTLRLRQFLLLVTRLALLAVLVLAAARLVLPVGGRDHPPGSLVLVVDNGLSSGLVVEGERVLDHLRARARDAVAAAGASDRVWVVAAGEPWRAAFPLTPSQADSLLATLGPTAVQADLGGALSRADALLAAAGDGPSGILVFSDFRGTRLSGLEEVESPVLLLGTEVPETPQRGIAEVRVGGGLPPRAGDPTEVEVRVAGSDSAGVAVRVHLGDELVAAGRTDERGWGVFPLPALEEGWRTGRVEIDPDALLADDQVPFALRVRPAPTVALLGPPPPFVAEALETLEAGGRIRVTAAAGAQVHVLAGEPGLRGAPPDPTTDPDVLLTVVLPPRDPSLLPAMNRWLEARGTSWRVGLHDGAPGTENRLEVAGTGFPPALDEVTLQWRVQLQGPDSGVLLRTDDGAPWLVEEEEAPGRRLRILASPLDRASSDLPHSAAMLPFMDRLLDPAEGAGIVTAVEAGHPLPLPVEVRQARAPDGTLHAADGIPSLLETSRPGIWDLLDREGDVVARIAVRPAPPPGPGITAEAAAGALGSGARVVADPVRWEREVLPDRKGREVAPLLAVLALLLLVAEGWLAAPDRASRLQRSPTNPHPHSTASVRRASP
jgi:hypothetical protein